MGIRLIKISVVYFVIGICLGYYMGSTENSDFTPVHAHINLLGWTALTLAGLIYVVFPRAAETVLAKLHFWLHNIGLPIMMISLAFIVSKVTSALPYLIVGETLVLIGVILFAINVLVYVKKT